jgi:AraC-like DNA-binding protein
MSDSPIYLDGECDALSAVLEGLQLSAEVYVSGDFCGTWAVDTSGSRRVPFHLIGGGSAWLHLQGEGERHLGAGDLVIFPNDHKHTISSSSETPLPELINIEPSGVRSGEKGPVTNMICGFFEFKNKTAWSLLESLEPVIVLELSDLSTLPQLRGLIDLLLSELSSRPPGYYSSINQIAHLIFIQAIRQQISSGRVETGLLSALFDPKLSLALSRIHNKPEAPWTLVSLAKEANMGRSSFAKRFHELIGMPAMQYLGHWRMQNATELLKHTSLSVWQIAEKSGYESEPAFRKAFKKTTGQTPGKVRRGVV